MPPKRRKEEIEQPNAYGGSGRYPALRFESRASATSPIPPWYYTDLLVADNRRDNDQVFHRNAIRLFARDFDFYDDAILACLRRDISVAGLYTDVVIERKLIKLRWELQQEMLGSEDLQSRVFDHARKYDETHADDAKLKDKPKEERDAVWAIAFNDVVFWIMVDPLRQGIKVDRFRAIEEWKKIYRAMFITAADTMYMGRLGGPKLTHQVDMQKVYSAVRSVIVNKFPDRPKFDTIPSQPAGWWDQTHRKTRVKLQKASGGSEWANATFLATPKEARSKKARSKKERDSAAARSDQPLSEEQ
ncbi:uncharacterized protein N0V89_002033 [Didymosphaeria variabile]|uniref:Uncharacterized protein n=1 Tax=Didymosphaeria variabile TaxID=1932322 RepID=A0A9W9CEA7_9PLEO|nr:uncharacterized protein N0V89_002033 [Didymosphaeria variabile]KAJ4357458.1 hypothetical protein N0V89_002033 [Didymosphaeria variabile]